MIGSKYCRVSEGRWAGHEKRQVEKPEDWKKQRHETKRRSERAAQLTPKNPEPGEKRESCERKKVLPPNRRADLPARINDGEICRAEKVAQVKPKQSPRNQAAVDQGEIKSLAMLGAKFLLDPNGDEPGEQRGAKKWNEWFQIADPGEFSAFPPEDDQEHHRQGEHGRL